jgi:DNA-binding MarR family transcriptional regulator
MEEYNQPNPDQSIGALVGRLGKVMQRALTEKFRTEAVDLNVDQCIVLMHLWEEDGQNQAQLGETAGRNKTTVTRAIDTLERKSFVVRVSDKIDRRHKLIYLTQSGRDMLAQVFPHLHQIQESATQGIEAAEMETCKSVLRRMFHNLKHFI